MKSFLSELDNLSITFKKSLNLGMKQLILMVTPLIRSLLKNVETISYMLSEAECAENDVNDPWVQGLLHSVLEDVLWVKDLMTANTYNSFVHLVINLIVGKLEVIMMHKRFNVFGGIQFDKDVRALVTGFSGMTQGIIRKDKFARLDQMAIILNLENVSRILYFWGKNSDSITWRLTPADVRRVLGLRVDFEQQEISALEL